MHIPFGHLGPFCGNQGIGEKISILIHVFAIFPGSSRNPVGGIETFPLPFKASRHGPAEYAGKFCHQLVQKLVILFIVGYRHIKRNEMDPSPDGMIGSLDLGWIIGRQPEPAAGNELEILLVQVSRCYLGARVVLLILIYFKICIRHKIWPTDAVMLELPVYMRAQYYYTIENIKL